MFRKILQITNCLQRLSAGNHWRYNSKAPLRQIKRTDDALNNWTFDLTEIRLHNLASDGKFYLFDSLSPINNLSVIKGQVFLG